MFMLSGDRIDSAVQTKDTITSRRRYQLVVHVYDISAVGQKYGCDRLSVESNRMIPAKNLGERMK